MMIEPACDVSASASANSVDSRSGANALVSSASRRASWLSVVSGSIGGIAKALLIRQSTRPYSVERGVDQALAGVLVVDVGRYDERPAAVRPDHLGHLVQPLLRCGEASTRSAPCLGRLLAQRAPQPGPDPGEHDHLALQQLRSTPVVSAIGSRHEIILRAMPTWRAAMRAVYSSAVIWFAA